MRVSQQHAPFAGSSSPKWTTAIIYVIRYTHAFPALTSLGNDLVEKPQCLLSYISIGIMLLLKKINIAVMIDHSGRNFICQVNFNIEI